MIRPPTIRVEGWQTCFRSRAHIQSYWRPGALAVQHVNISLKKVQNFALRRAAKGPKEILRKKRIRELLGLN
jgi:hypothetical protein